MASSDRPSPRRAWRAVRRRVLLHRRGLAALLVALAAATALASLRAPAPATTGVWVAAHDLDDARRLSASDLRLARVPSDAVPDGALGRASLVERQLAGAVRRGEPLTDRRVLGTDLLAAYPGRVAVPVRLADPGASSLLRAGQRVDLMRMDPQGDRPATLLAPRAVVLSVVADPADDAGLTAGTGAGGLVLAAVEEGTAPDVAAAGAAGFLTVAFPR